MSLESKSNNELITLADLKNSVDNNLLLSIITIPNLKSIVKKIDLLNYIVGASSDTSIETLSDNQTIKKESVLGLYSLVGVNKLIVSVTSDIGVIYDITPAYYVGITFSVFWSNSPKVGNTLLPLFGDTVTVLAQQTSGSNVRLLGLKNGVIQSSVPVGAADFYQLQINQTSINDTIEIILEEY